MGRPAGTFTLTFNGQTTGRFSSVDVLQADKTEAGGIADTTIAETKAKDARERVNKVDAFTIKQGVTRDDVPAIRANTPLVLHGFIATDPNWNPASLPVAQRLAVSLETWCCWCRDCNGSTLRV